MSAPFDTLRARLGRISDLSNAANVLEWDQETQMPSNAAEARAVQITTLREMAHELLISDETVDLVEACDAGASDDDAFWRPLLKVLRRDLDRNRRIPAPLIARLAGTSARAKEAWKKARLEDDFSAFAPHLEQVLALTLEKADAVGYAEHPYDALLDEYEPDAMTSAVRALFTDLRRELVPLVERIRDVQQVDDEFLHRHYDRQVQWDFGLQAARDIGYDFSRGRQDVSTHPFSTSFSATDCRITTRIQENFFPTGFFGTLHEAGHALYEQGVDPAYERTPLAGGTSLGTHESQSRLWENQVGRRRSFWERYFPRLQDAFPGVVDDVDADTFYRGVNRVEPSFIRVEADEVTYNLHVMLRFELETELVTGNLQVRDVPEAWNDRMEEYLGVRPRVASEGALQDIHWSLAAIGYFPTYTLGTLMSAQLSDAAEREIGALDDLVREGDYPVLLKWLRRTVHRWGRARSTNEILQDVTGGGLDARPWLTYVRTKYGPIYGI